MTIIPTTGTYRRHTYQIVWHYTTFSQDAKLLYLVETTVDGMGISETTPGYVPPENDSQIEDSVKRYIDYIDHERAIIQ